MSSSPQLEPEGGLAEARPEGDSAGGASPGGFFSRMQVLSLLMLVAVLGLGLFLLKHRQRLSAEPLLVSGDESAYALRINVNDASWEELALLPGIGRQRAEAIVAHRDANGPFAGVDDLREVEGIGEKLSESIAPYVVFE